MNMPARRMICPLLMLGVLLMITAGCGAVDEDAGSVDSDVEYASEIVYGLRADPETLDPQRAIDQPSAQVLVNIYNALLQLGDDGQLEPDLAEDYEITDDGLTWTFYLRDDVQFHDGTDFNAQAVKEVYERQFAEELGLAFGGRWGRHVEGPDSIRVVDEYTLEIETISPSPYFGYLVATGAPGYIPSPAAIEEHGEDLGTNPVGTGPFVFERWASGEEVVLRANENYYDEGPYIDTLRMRIITEDSAREMALEAGDIHMAPNIPPRSIPGLEAEEGIEVVESPLYRVFYWAFNCTQPYFEDVRVRQAFNHAIDKESIVEHVLQGVGVVTHSPLSPISEGYVETDMYEHDPDLARDMLEEAGWDFDRELTSYITSGRYYQDRETGEALAGMLDEIGVQVNTEVLEWGAFVDAVWFTPHDDPEAQARDFMQTTWGSEDVAWTLQAVLHGDAWPPNVYNEAFFAHDRADELIDAVETEIDDDQRLEYLAEVQELIMEEAPWIPVYAETQVFAKTDRLEDVRIWTELVRWDQARLRE